MTGSNSLRNNRRGNFFEHAGRKWPVPSGCTRIGRGWRVVAPAGHPEAGRTREFKAQLQGEMANYLAAMDWYHNRPDRSKRLPPSYRVVPVNGMSLVVPTGVKRITSGWRSTCPDHGVEPGVTRDFSDPQGDARISLERAIAWRDGQELVPRNHDRQPRIHLKAKRATAPEFELGPTQKPHSLPLITEAVPKNTEGPGRGSNWSIQEEIRLLILISSDMALQDISRVMKRTYRAVQQKAMRLTDPSWTSVDEAPPERRIRATDAWEPEDDLVLITWRGLLPVGVIQRVFFSGADGGPKKGPMAVGLRMKELGLALDKEEAVELAAYARDVVRLAEVQLSHIDQPPAPTKKQATAFPRKSRLKRWTPEEDEILVNNRGLLPLAEIHRRFFHNPDGTEKRSYAAIAQRIGALNLSLDRASAARLSKPR